MKAVMIIISAGALFLLAEKRATKSNKVIVEEAFERWASGKGSVFDLLDERVEWTIAGSGKSPERIMERMISLTTLLSQSWKSC